MAGLLNDAVDQAERLAGENKELRRKQEDAVLDKCAPAASHACRRLWCVAGPCSRLGSMRGGRHADRHLAVSKKPTAKFTDGAFASMWEGVASAGLLFCYRPSSLPRRQLWAAQKETEKLCCRV